MALNAPAFVTVSPSRIEPDLILPYAQASAAFDLIEGGEPRVKLGEGDLYVYMKRVDLRTSMAAGPASYNQLPGVSISFSQIMTPTYLLQVAANYNHHDVAAAQNWGVSLSEAYRLGMRQGHFQLARNALLYGFNPQSGEGLLNAAGATAVNLPPDSTGATTVVTYDNGEMAFFLLQQFGALKSRTNQMGIGHKFTVIGPQRTLEQFEYPGIVQLTQYQRVGAGSATTAQMIKEVLMSNGDSIIWGYDDTLTGKGAGGNDAVLISMPEVDKPSETGINTNEFAKLSPGNNACITMYADQAAPKELTSPMARGMTDVLSEMRITSGWPIRPEALTIISMQYQ
jgi:hypothetical protein